MHHYLIAALMAVWAQNIPLPSADWFFATAYEKNKQKTTATVDSSFVQDHNT